MVSWNKGLTKETDKRVKKNAESGREKKRLSHLGKKYSKEHKENISKGLKNKPKSEEHKKKLSLALKGKTIGRKNPFYGKKHTEESIKKISNKAKGRWTLEKNPKWKGGIKYEKYGFDFNEELKVLVRKRDNFTCQICKKRQIKPKLDVHHKDENKKNNSPNNLISFCHYCHINLHNKKIKLEGGKEK